ncbi:hypothetical protein ACFQ4C_07200 [Larkinella insperata]|uniref:Uncharacterized protein n=2 Tax=Larkinella TaxID=332157 RepID=A0ABW0ICX2_9BACT
MRKLLEWAAKELTTRHRLRKNQVLGQMNHAGPDSVEFTFLDMDHPEQGAVELLQIQVSRIPQRPNDRSPVISCQVSTLMEVAPRSDKGKDHTKVLRFDSTQDVIHWLENNTVS